jgi:predicted RNase H-like HicB family nuclease
MTFKVIIERGEDGYFVAHCPSLKSCWSQGRTREEAILNIQEAIELYLEPPPQQLMEDDRRELVAITL